MNKVVEDLLLLQNLELGEKTKTPEIMSLRAKIPTKSLTQYDRLQQRGKKGVALVRNGVCTGCHIRVPVGTTNSLMLGLSALTCDSCGRFLYLSPEQCQLIESNKTHTAQLA
jgi:predicted  nucleic acid-binding Zn-ribbon protein